MIPDNQKDPKGYAKWRNSIKPLPVGTMLKYQGKLVKITGVRDNTNMYPVCSRAYRSID